MVKISRLFQGSKRRVISAAALSATLGVFLSAPAFADVITWADWTSTGSNSVLGTLTVGSNTVGLSYSGNLLFAQTGNPGDINYWNPATPYLSPTISNAPPPSDIIAMVGGNAIVNTITFDAPVVDPVMALVSLGNNGQAITYEFTTPYTLLSSGTGYWGGSSSGSLTQISPTVLGGVEGHGAIKFTGTYSSISWTVPTGESWHGFTVGVTSVAAVPEASTLSLLALGGVTALGIVCRAVRRRG